MRRGRSAAVLAVALAVATACSSGAPTAPAAVESEIVSSPSPRVAASPSPGLRADGGEIDARLVGTAAPRAIDRLTLDPGRALAHVVALAAIGPRIPGSAEDREARAYVAAAFEDAGWAVVQEPFPLPQGGESANVVAWRGGSEPPYGEPHVVVGGHLDTVEGSPGANDNASGIGVILALAGALGTEISTPLPVILVAFGAEERQPAAGRPHHVGSDAYAAAHAGEVVAMVSVDMVGHGDRTCICWYAAGPGTLADRLLAVAKDTGIGDVYVAGQGDISDHGPFALRGVPAAFLWTGVDARYHSPRDTAEHVRAGDLARAGVLVLALLADLGAEDAAGLASP